MWCNDSEGATDPSDSLIGEYVAGLDAFAAGELYDALETGQCQPTAWNLELAAAISDALELAVRFSG